MNQTVEDDDYTFYSDLAPVYFGSSERERLVKYCDTTHTAG